MKRIFVGLLLILITGVCASCGYVSSAELLSYTNADKNVELTIDTEGVKYNMSFLNFSAELISRVNEDKNILLSPLSIYIALSMLVNGCDNDTKVQIEEMLGLSVDELNEYCYYIISGFSRDNSTLNIANSLWVNRDMNIDVKKPYLDINALYYDIEVYRDSFSDKKALSNINHWVNVNTQGMIKEILDSIDPMTAMILINSLYFEAEWTDKSYNYSTYEYANNDGTASNVDF